MNNEGSEIKFAVAFLIAGLVALALAWFNIFTDLSGVWRIAKIGAFLSVVLNVVALGCGVNEKASPKGPFVVGSAICLLILTTLLIGLILIGGLGM
jgi:hypothetical protein